LHKKAVGTFTFYICYIIINDKVVTLL